MNVDKTLETIQDLQDLVVDGIAVVKSMPFGFGTIGKVLKCAGDVKELVADAPEAWPELHELDAEEVGNLGAAGYGLVKAVIGALAA